MKYITSVAIPDKKIIKHIIDCGKGNEEIIESLENESYGNQKGNNYFKPFYGLKVYQDFTFILSSSNDSIHLAKLVVAIEKCRFIHEFTRNDK